YDTFLDFPDVSLPGSISTPYAPGIGAAADATGGWEDINLNTYCLDGQSNGDNSWRVRTTTLFQLAALDLGSRTAGTYGNGGSWSFSGSTPPCQNGTGCFVNSGLLSPTVDFGSLPAPGANDV